MTGDPRIGVLALQGAFREHAAALRALGADVVEVRLPQELDGLDGLVIPGGESTTIMRLAELYGLDEAIRAFPGVVFGTCAGMIVLDGEHLASRRSRRRPQRVRTSGQELRGGCRARRRRHPAARRLHPRAADPRVSATDVEVIGELDGEPVLVRDGRFLLASFHPELTEDLRVHQLFLTMVEEASSVRA